MKVGDLVVFPRVDVETGHFDDQGIGMVVEIYEHTTEYQGVVEVGCELVDVLWPDGDLIHGYLARDFEVIDEASSMKVGDYVRTTDARDDDLFLPHDGTALTGIIIDAIELPDGFSEYEVLLEDGDVMWCSDLSLKVLSESR